MKKIFFIAGTRPNFIKIAPIWKRLPKSDDIRYCIVHTGQHYDYEMSRVFFEELNLPEPDIFLSVGSGTHNYQIAQIMLKLEKHLSEHSPDLVVVVGDVNSTLAAAMASVKCEIPVAHIEAGLRSFDDTMPEEINRRITDTISSILFTYCTDANENLIREGVPAGKIRLVGNVMIDNLIDNLNSIKLLNVIDEFGLKKYEYCVLTLHRNSNVDDEETLSEILRTIQEISAYTKIVFPVHPRTRKKIDEEHSEITDNPNVIITKPMSYMRFLNLVLNSKLVLTDSGGIQEETSFLGIPCITLRNNTERPITVKMGTNVLAGMKRKNIVRITKELLNRNVKRYNVKIPYWDGKASERIIRIIMEYLHKPRK